MTPPAGSVDAVTTSRTDPALAAAAIGGTLAAGGTAWCIGPARDIVAGLRDRGAGDRAIAVADAADTVLVTRSGVRVGDIVVLAAHAHDRVANEICVRALAWGARTVWLGTGPRPAPGRADHVVWSEDQTVRGRDLLDDLARELVTAPFVVGPVDTDPGETCITCADEGIVSEVVSVLDDVTVTVRDADGERTVDTTLVGPVAEHDLVLVHAGTAISCIDIPVRQGHP